jgi:hypothetical protein
MWKERRQLITALLVQQSNPEDLKPQISHRLWVFESSVLGRYFGTGRRK